MIAHQAKKMTQDALRGFRDRVLLRSTAGRLFTETYYRVGPVLAGAVARSPVLSDLTRATLRRLIPHLERLS